MNPLQNLGPTFWKALFWALYHEGLFANSPGDPGGFTRWGIASKEHPELSVATMTFEAAATWYYDTMWKPIGLDALSAPEPAVAIKLFDIAVQFGPGKAVMLLQDVLVDLGEPVKVDGLFGAQTLEAVRRVIVVDLLKALCLAMATQYQADAKNDPAALAGWLKRAAETPA